MDFRTDRLLHGVVSGFKIVVGEAVEPVIKGEARLLHGILRAQTAHPAGKTGGGTAQHRDLAVPLCDEVSHGDMGRRPVIHAHHGKVGEVELVRDEGGQHRGDGDVGKAVLEIGYAAAQKDDALGLDLPQDLFGRVDLVGVFVDVGDDAVVAVQGGRPLQLDQKVREEEVAGALDHKDHAPRLLDLELAGVGVGDEPGFPHDF